MSMVLDKHRDTFEHYKTQTLAERRARIHLDNMVLFISIVIIAFLLMVVIRTTILAPYQITYVEYHMKQNDSLYNVVQDMNDYTPFGWNIQDFVALAMDKNNIQDASTIRHGQVVMIPIAKSK
jgi:hypothetical protein